ncbi:uncharacterized protein LOC110111870 isoform X1 [Dendrobium catenatum]|uniref:THUMP domain-containing protein n=1 Tax=Dendrobium catenatum TaxID=906689 RepID=A0A2I0VTE6_9ASPA|nr:uncharacterized protein LOC110111870 isoform X1 [Dendrobium catenatum]XP_028555852.1 uncharacterized protein LOC110111870 isoform X1 [Dendrobium catenatum]XP_028555853.1 uncharacterized protein LOC110111870 isoform X1 [Dendrobium catenatum]PKU66676.1 hypothetical protein MA16_Dca024404 [Dendrobium catenatum]
MAELGIRDERGVEQAIELGLGKEDSDQDKKDEDFKPWEQHSAVISIPRYDYKAPSSLLERSHSGFLITCPIKREKSATKEAIPILEKHMKFVCTNDFERSEPCSKIVVAKRRKTCSQDADSSDRLEKNIDANLSADSCETAELARLHPAADENANKRAISLVKLTRSGLLLFTLPVLNYQHVIDTLSSIFRSLGSGNQKPPIWCHRIFPIQETCCLTEKDLHAVVTNLVQRYFSSQQGKPERSIKFAVGYNRRGIEETELRNKKFTSTIALLEKNKCFSVVAGAFKNVVENSIVDLKSPEVVILVELLPLSGLPPESLMVGVSVLPSKFVITKPRLCVKPLLINTERNK